MLKLSLTDDMARMVKKESEYGLGFGGPNYPNLDQYGLLKNTTLTFDNIFNSLEKNEDRDTISLAIKKDCAIDGVLNFTGGALGQLYDFFGDKIDMSKRNEPNSIIPFLFDAGIHFHKSVTTHKLEEKANQHEILDWKFDPQNYLKAESFIVKGQDDGSCKKLKEKFDALKIQSFDVSWAKNDSRAEAWLKNLENLRWYGLFFENTAEKFAIATAHIERGKPVVFGGFLIEVDLGEAKRIELSYVLDGKVYKIDDKKIASLK